MKTIGWHYANVLHYYAGTVYNRTGSENRTSDDSFEQVRIDSLFLGDKNFICCAL